MPDVNLAALPWDFVLILAVLGIVIPWRGTVRIRYLLSRPELHTADRLSLYGTTIAFQWCLVALVAWRASARGLAFQSLGLTTGNTGRTIIITIAFASVLCAWQFAGLRRLLRMPHAERGAHFHLIQKIMPQAFPETMVFVALATTAGLSEEFLYRGFVLTVWKGVFANFGYSVLIGVVLSSAWFAAAHLYQGKRGLITTFVVAIAFCIVRIWSGSLVPCVVAHIGIDLIAGVYLASAHSSRLVD